MSPTAPVLSGVRTAVTLSGAGPVATATAEPEPSNCGTVTREAGDEAGGAVAGETYGYSEQPPPGTRLLPRDSVPKPSRRSPDLNRPRPASPERDSKGFAPKALFFPRGIESNVGGAPT